MKVMDRFNKYINKVEECWEWTGSLTSDGYGKFFLNGKEPLAHRVSFWLHFGRWPNCQALMHTCDNTKCVRPDHLIEGSHADNQRDKTIKGRQAKGEANGRSILNEQNVRDIRHQYSAGTHTIELARKFCVDKKTIYNIVRRLTWKYLV